MPIQMVSVKNPAEPKFNKLAEWKRSAAIDESGTVFMPALMESETLVMLAAGYDNTPVVTDGGHVYVPCDWVRKNYPTWGEVAASIEANLRRHGYSIKSSKSPVKEVSVYKGDSMKTWVKLYKDGDSMGIETNASEQREFWMEFSRTLVVALQANRGDETFQLERWLPQSFEVVAKLRGYKTEADVFQVLRVGAVYGEKTQTVYEVEEKPDLKMVK